MALAWAAGCGKASTVGGESHFVCRTQSDCDPHPDSVCFRADPGSDTGKCVSKSELADAAKDLGTGGAGGRGPEGGPSTGAVTNMAYCGASERATYPALPTGVPASTKNVEIVAAQYTIDLGDAPPNAGNPPSHYLEIGFDLDNVCTTSANLTVGMCKLASYGVGVVDGPGGIDSALGSLIQAVRSQIGNFNSDNYSKNIQAGKSNMLLRLQNWNGEANDDQVTFSAMAAAPFDSFTSGAKPAWNGNDAWPVSSDAVVGDVEHPKSVDRNGYVKDFQLVATFDAAANLGLNLGLTDVLDVKLDMMLAAAFLVCTIVPETTGSWGYTFSKCTLGGRWAASDFVKQLGQFPDPLNNNKPLCAGTQQYQTLKEGICSQADLFHDPAGSPTQTCDALSVGVTFTTKPALFGNLYTLAPEPDPCPADPRLNPKYDCCESIGAPDAGALQACGFSGIDAGSSGSGGSSGALDSGPG